MNDNPNSFDIFFDGAISLVQQHAPEVATAAGKASIVNVGKAFLASFQKRQTEKHRNMLLDEMRHANVSIEHVMQRDEFVHAVIRVQRSAMENAASMNLRFLCAAVAGRISKPEDIADDDFQSFIPILESFRRIEIETLSRFINYELYADQVKVPTFGPNYDSYYEKHVRDRYGDDIAEYTAILYSLMRTGLIVQAPGRGSFGGAGGPFVGTKRLRALASLIPVSDVLRRHDEASQRAS